MPDTKPGTTPAAKRVRARLPGPPGPNGPPAISKAIEEWHLLVEAEVTGGQCQPLLESVRQLGSDVAAQPGGPPYVSLYRGIAEGCLGQLSAAGSDLRRARQVGLGPDDTSKDKSCNAQLLLVYGFDAYLNQQISPVCPPPTSTTQVSTPTTS